MEYTIFQVALVFIVTFVAAIDQFNFLESLYQPIVTGAVIGLIPAKGWNGMKYTNKLKNMSRALADM